MAGKCPKCDRLVTAVDVYDLDIRVRMQSKWKGVQYVCPFCQTVLSIQMDPIALKADTVGEVAAALKRR